MPIRYECQDCPVQTFSLALIEDHEMETNHRTVERCVDLEATEEM